jgi:ABC-2 type transport system permease protein
MNRSVLFAVFRRNFVSYFANPTGYLFICVFVVMCALAAFWPDKFFNSNLANLDQLTLVLPLIMLVFIPSITMGVWSDERRQGTDELLLTIPASDFDVVLGKYLAAVMIFSTSLAFSLLCNFCVLRWLGNPDLGLFLGTYFGYWLIGLTMLAVGMVASFLTANLTVGYILGVAFNAPLVFAAWANLFPFPALSSAIRQCSLGEHLSDFGRGVISLSSVAYFAVLASAMIYLCMVLIGRRHWQTGSRGGRMVLHYTLRVLSIAVIAVGVTYFLRNYDIRWDTTSEGLNSLTPQTREILQEMKFQRPVLIEAFVSPEVPESYVQTRLNLLALLREFEALGRGKIRVVVHDTEPLSEAASLAQERYGIEPRDVIAREHGVLAKNKLFLHLVISCGRERVPPLFLDRGIPIEYELIRSLGTVTQPKQKRIGVLLTDAHVMGRFNPMNPSASGNWAVVDELQKQYEVVSVDPAQPITEKYDVLLAVQPSTLGPEEMKHFIAAVKEGQPTAIFEDPFPRFFTPEVAGTTMPRSPPGGMEMMMMMGPRTLPKGDLRPLWDFLGVKYTGDEVVWQQYNPYPTAQFFTPEWVIVDQGQFARTGGPGAPADARKKPDEKVSLTGRNAFNPDDIISSGLQQVLIPYPGLLTNRNASQLQFIPLVQTGQMSGIVRVNELLNMTPFGPRGINENPREEYTGLDYVLAAEIRGKVSQPAPDPDPPAGEDQAGEKLPAKKSPVKEKETEIHVVLVSDIDLLYSEIFRLRELGANNPDFELNFDFDNVTFILNVLDTLAGSDPRYLEIRKHRPQHRTLVRVEEKSEAKKLEVAKAREEFNEEYNKADKELNEAVQNKINEVRNRKDIDSYQKSIDVALTMQTEQDRLKQELEAKRRERDRKIANIESGLEKYKLNIQNRYKLWAVLFPPILPLAIGIAVFFTRRTREKEGVDRSRLR